MEMIELEKIKIDPVLYPRINHDDTLVAKYAGAMLTGAVFPPICITYFEDKILLVDGYHRLKAYELRKEKYASCEVFPFEDKDKIYIEAIRRNVAHGKDLSEEDRLQCVQRLKGMKLSEEKISEIVRLPTFIFKRMVPKTIEKTFERKPLPVKTYDEDEVIHSDGFLSYRTSPVNMDDINQIDSLASSEAQIRIISQMISYFENGSFDFNNNYLISKLKQLKELIDDNLI